MSHDVQILQQKALKVKELYSLLNNKQGYKKWTTSDYMAGFVTDVGELSELIMAKQGIRRIDEVDTKLAHELADCLYSLLVLAYELDVDLTREFHKTMDSLTEKLEKKLGEAA